MRCVAVDSSTGVVVDIDPQPADPTSCALVLAAPAEVNSPFAMSVVDATTIGVSILGLWAGAWVFRVLGRTLSAGDTASEE